MKPIVVALALLAAPAAATPEAEVGAALDAVMAAINVGDAAAFTAATHPNLAIHALSFRPDGTSRLRAIGRDELVAGFAARGPMDERLTARTIHITRDFAQVWAPYTLDIGGKRRHCGVDSFAFMKLEGRWLLTSLAWTADPGGCPQ